MPSLPSGDIPAHSGRRALRATVPHVPSSSNACVGYPNPGRVDLVTLVLTLASRAFVLQVSDRMLSRSLRPLYPASNKTVVVLARNGMYTMSCTGLARLGSVATDDWMARQVAGVVDWGPPPLAWVMQGRLPQWLDVGRGVAAITDGLNDAFAHDVSPSLRDFPHAVTLAGWQWKVPGSHARPIFWSIERDASGRFVATDRFPRDHFGSGFYFSAMPGNSTLRMEELKAILDKLRNGAAMNADAARTLFVETMRLAASRRPRVVGPHCMTVMLYPPRCDVRFIPDPANIEQRPLPPPFDDPRLRTTMFVHPAAQTDRREAAPLDAAYTPWLVVGDDLVVSHSLVQGTTAPMIYSRGQFEFHVGGGSV